MVIFMILSTKSLLSVVVSEIVSTEKIILINSSTEILDVLNVLNQ
jgi:hypothetical protein